MENIKKIRQVPHSLLFFRKRCINCKANKYIKYLSPLFKNKVLYWKCSDIVKCKKRQFMDKMYV